MADKAVKTKKNAASNDGKKPATSAEPEFYGRLPIQTIAIRTGLNRATVADRLKLHKYKPVDGHEKLKLYEFDEEMEAVLLETNTKFNEARTRKAEAEAEKVEFVVKQMKGELVPFGEAVDAYNQTVGGLYKEIVVRLPKRLAARLAKASTSADVTALLGGELDKVFQELRANPSMFLPTEKKASQAA